jgi:hypothetical protein
LELTRFLDTFLRALFFLTTGLPESLDVLTLRTCLDRPRFERGVIGVISTPHSSQFGPFLATVLRCTNPPNFGHGFFWFK